MVSDGLSGTSITLYSDAPGDLLSWTTADALPTSLILPQLGRTVGENLLGSGSVFLPSVGARISGKERYVSLVCATHLSYCVAATETGSIVSWGISNPSALGRTDLFGM